MIKYEQIQEGEVTPKDIKAITDDADAEMAGLEEAFEQSEWEEARTLESIRGCKRNSEGVFEFVIAGIEAGEVSDVIADVDNGKLQDFLDELNMKAISDMDDDA